MTEKELSHHESALQFINNLQRELAKTNSSTTAQRSDSEARDMAPPQIRRLQKSKAEIRDSQKAQRV